MKFSIGIPAYKAKYLKNCIDSILRQDFKDFELIIVNDSSPEDIDAIISNYKDHRIRYFKNEQNIGAEKVVDNWNICLNYATEEFFVLMGDDDQMEIDYLTEFSKLIDKYPRLNVYHCRSKIINEKSEILQYTTSWPEFETVYENIWHRMTGNRLQFISDFIYRKKTLLENGGFYSLPLAWGSDHISSYIAMMSNGIAHTQKAVFCYRRNSFTISSTGNAGLKMNAINQEKHWIEDFLLKETSNFQDSIFRNNIKTYLTKYISKKKSLNIASDLYNKGPFFIFNWIMNRRKYDLSLLEIAYSIIEYIKKKKK